MACKGLARRNIPAWGVCFGEAIGPAGKETSIIVMGYSKGPGRLPAWRRFAPVAAAWLVLSLASPARAETLGVVPILIGPLQVLIAILPAMLLALGGAILAMFKPSAIKAGILVLWRNKISTVLVAAGITGVVYLGSFAFGGPKAGEAIEGAYWPVHRAGPQRRGAAPESADPVAGGINWAFTSECKGFFSSPAVVGNRVYVASTDKGPLKDRGGIYCLDADNMGVVWKYSPRDFRATYSSPAVTEKYVVCGEGLHVTRDARITCLDRQTGRRLWELRTRSHVESSACIHDGKVYIGAGDDGLYCIELEPDRKGDPKVVFHLPGKDYPDCETSPIAHDGKVYFGLGEGGSAVCAVDAKTGKPVWRTPTPYPAFGSPAIADGKVVIAMGVGNMIETAEQVRQKTLDRLRAANAPAEAIAAAEKHLRPVGMVWALDAKTGAVAWKYEQVGRTVLSNVAIADGRMYFGSRDGHLYCLSTDGEFIGKWNARSPIITAPAVGAEHVYFVTDAGRLYGLDRRTLRPVWEITAGNVGPFVSCPAVGRGHVYVGTGGDGLVCAGVPSSLKTEPVWGGYLGGAGESGWSDHSPLPPRAVRLWSYPKASGGKKMPRIHAPAASFEKALYVSFNAAGKTGLAKLVPAEQARQGATETWFYPTPNAIFASAAAIRGRVYVVDGRAGQTNRSLHCIDAKTGKGLWTRPIPDGASGLMLLTAKGLLICDGPGRVSCLRVADEPSDAVAWSQAVESPVGAPTLVGNLVLAASASGAVTALDLADGQVVWTAPVGGKCTTGPVGNADMFAVGTDRGLAVHSMVDGSGLWSADVGAAAGALVCDVDYVACIQTTPNPDTDAAGPTGPGQVFVFEWVGRGGWEAVKDTWDIAKHVEDVEYRFPGQAPSPGKVLRLKGTAAGIPPMFCGGRMFYCTDDHFEQIEFHSGKVRRWLRSGWLGRVTAGPILVDSRAYFATDAKGLVCAGQRK